MENNATKHKVNQHNVATIKLLEKNETCMTFIEQFKAVQGKLQLVLELQIDFSGSEIQQETVDEIMKNNLTPQTSQNNKLEEQIAAFQAEILSLKKVKLIIPSDSLLNKTDFVTNFYNYTNIQEIELVCNSSDIAHSFLKVTKNIPQLETIACEDYFYKQSGVYTVQSGSFYAESLDGWQGIENQIEDLIVQIDAENFEKIQENLLKCTKMERLQIDMLSLNSIQENVNSLINGFKENCKKLNSLILQIYVEQLLDPINNEEFEENFSIEMIYRTKLITIPMSQILRNITYAVQHHQKLQISSLIKLSNNILKLDLNNRILSSASKVDQHEATSGEESSDLKELFRLLAVLNSSKIYAIEIKFQNSQSIPRLYLVEMLKMLCGNESLQRVFLNCSSISPQLSAMSLAKLVKTGKINALVNGSYYKDNKLTLVLDQMSHNILNFLMNSNCLMKNASKFEEVNITTETIIGKFEQFVGYFKTDTPLKQLYVIVNSSNVDIIQLLQSCIIDRNQHYNFNLPTKFEIQFPEQNSFFIQEIDSFICQYKNWQLDNESVYNLFSSPVPVNLIQQMFQLLEGLKFFQSYPQKPKDINDLARKLRFLQILYNFKVTTMEWKNLPFQLSVFFKVITPYLPINPFMVAADLYLD